MCESRSLVNQDSLHFLMRSNLTTTDFTMLAIDREVMVVYSK
jgi:hypothetical protein